MEAAWRAADAAEMAATPHCSAEPRHVECGRVGYAESLIYQFELANESAAPAEFELVEMPGAPAPPWVSLHPSAVRRGGVGWARGGGGGGGRSAASSPPPPHACLRPPPFSNHPKGMVERGDAIILTAHVCVTGGPGGAADAVMSAPAAPALDAILVLRVGGWAGGGERVGRGVGMEVGGCWC